MYSFERIDSPQGGSAHMWNPVLKPTGEVASFASELVDHGWEAAAVLSRVAWGL